MSSSIDVRAIMEQIRDRAQERTAWMRPEATPEAQLPEMGDLERAARALRLRRDLVGEMPAGPPTLRGRLGALLVKVTRRALSWYTPQIRDFHESVVEGFEWQEAVLKAVVAQSRQNRDLVEDLRKRVEELSVALARLEHARASTQPPSARQVPPDAEAR